MKKYLFIVFLLFSCEKEPPALNSGVLYFDVMYEKNTGFSIGSYPDFKSTVVVFPNMEILPYALDVDANGNIMYMSNIIKSDKIITINSIGEGFIDLPFGTYSAVCISVNFKSQNKKSYKSCIFDFNEKERRIRFDFEL